MGNSSSCESNSYIDIKHTDREEIYKALANIPEGFACSTPMVNANGKKVCAEHDERTDRCFEDIARRNVTRAAEVKERILKEAVEIEKKAEENKANEK